MFSFPHLLAQLLFQLNNLIVFGFPSVPSDRIPITASYVKEDLFEEKKEQNKYYPFDSEPELKLASWIEENAISVRQIDSLLSILTKDFRIPLEYRNRDQLERKWKVVPSLV